MLAIYFCFPYRGVGGVSPLFVRIAEHLQQHHLAQCHLVDYADGLMARLSSDIGVQLEVYQDEGGKIAIPDGAVAVFQSMTPWSIFPGITLTSDVRIFYWNCHPFNLIPLLPGFRRPMQGSEGLARLVLGTILRRYRKKIGLLIALLISNNAIGFMDSTNLRITENYLGVAISDPIFLPIPALGNFENQFIAISRDLSKQLRVVWVGRIVDFKFFTLHRALVELNKLQPALGRSIGVTIVGEGDYCERLNTVVSSLQNLEFKFIKSIPAKQMDNFVVQNTDLLIAMGTSALEGARLGVPTILLDIAYAPVSADYRFCWLYERTGFTLGDVVGVEHFAPGNDSMASCIRELINNLPQVSAMTFSYVQKNHDLTSIGAKMLQVISSSNCTYGELYKAGLLERGFLYSIYTKIRRELSKL